MNHLNCSTNQTNFKQIIKVDRITIEVLLKQGISVAKIAQHLGKHRSSIYREIRRFFLKRTKFDNVSEKQIKKVQNWMNNKPRKILGYLTPLELMSKVCPQFINFLTT